MTQTGFVADTLLIPIPSEGFEPTEVVAPWRHFRDAGYAVAFATADGRAARCDPLALERRAFGQIGARPEHAAWYAELEQDAAYRSPLRWADVQPDDFSALHLPGGHAKTMRPYLESATVQALAVRFVAAGRPTAAICHGPIVLARAIDPATGRSPIHGRRVTSLTRSMERTAWWLTRASLGDHFRTYPTWVEDEVRAALGPEGHYERGPLFPSYRRPFVVTDGALLSARWPGDAEALALALLALVRAGLEPAAPAAAAR
jgi:putative intracellular protease/amidase